MVTTLNVLIVEDDFRVAAINRQLIENISGFHVVGEMKTAAETLEFLTLTKTVPDLILLDIYIPDSPGLELFWKLRKEFPTISVIILSATKDTETIGEALDGGVLDFLIKPVDHERFTQSFTRYRSRKVLVNSKSEFTQADIDRIFSIETCSHSPLSTDGLPKGIDQLTLDRIVNIIDDNQKKGMTATETGETAGVSRSTARRYLEYLVSIKVVEAQLHYGDVGRPERTYTKL